MPPDDSAIGRQKGRGRRETRQTTSSTQAPVASRPMASSETEMWAMKPGSAASAFMAMRGGQPDRKATQ